MNRREYIGGVDNTVYISVLEYFSQVAPDITFYKREFRRIECRWFDINPINSFYLFLGIEE